jgi:DNA polymerase III subunit gamma/tau
MSYVVLARKYRPRNFAQMVGQEHVVRALTNALSQQRLHHAYLFTGTRGIGKTTVSRILAKSLNCIGPDGQGGITAEPCGRCTACTEIDADRYIDYIELDAASNRGIDEARDLIERAAYKPGIGRFKVFMIDEAHQLTKDAFSALLKTLEEPPEYLKFVLATTDPERMLPTVLSRCLQFNLRPMAPDVVRAHLQQVLDAEQVPWDEGALRLIGRAARGSMRDALSLTDQAIAYAGGKLEEAVVRTMLGAVDRRRAARLADALVRRDAAALLAEVDGLRDDGLSAAGTLEELASLAQQAAVEQAVPGALPADDPEADAARELAPRLAADELQLLYSLALHGRSELGLAPDEYAALVMVLLRFLAFPPLDASRPAAPPRANAALQVPRAQARTSAPVTALAAAPLRAPVAAAAPIPAVIVEPDSKADAGPDHTPEAPPPPATTLLGDRWRQTVEALCESGAITALVRELALQSQLETIVSGDPPVWRLVVERESLRAPALADKLQAALAALRGSPLKLDVAAGTATDTPAARRAREQAARQREAEDTILNDPVVRSLMAEFSTARIVPGSIKPI